MKTTAFRFLLFLGKKFEFQGCICPCCAHLTSASDDEVAVEQGGVVQLLLPEVHTDAGQEALRGDVPGHGGGSGVSIGGNIEAGKEPVATAGNLHDHIVGVDSLQWGS